MPVDEIIKQLALQSPFVALLGAFLWVVYQDGKSERAALIQKLDIASDQLADIKERIVRLEVAEFGNKYPTAIRKPDQA